MKRSLLALLFGIALSAPASASIWVADLEGEGNNLALQSSRCLHAGILATAKALPPKPVPAVLYAATVLWEGKSLGACWGYLTPSLLLVIDESGDAGWIALSRFTRREVF